MKRALWLFRRLEEAVCCACLALISVCVIVQVVMRYVFNSAPHWTEEIAAIAMVWAVYMGASLCVRERFHIRIMFAVLRAPEKTGRAVMIAADAVWAAFSIFMIRVNLEYLAVLWKYTSRTPSLGIDEFYPQSVLVIGYALMLARLAEIYVKWLREGAPGLPGVLREDGAPPPR